ncbi:MAG: TadE/TadG family type IV pilus assembly protein [Terracidiphilus sp.]
MTNSNCGSRKSLLGDNFPSFRWLSRQKRRRTGSLSEHGNRLLASDEQGGALVEMALVMPIMLAMLTSIFSFSVVLYQKLQLGEAVSNAGRVMALERGDTDPCATTANSIYAAAPSLGKANMTLTFTLGGTNTGGSVSGGTSYGGTKGTAPSCTAAGNGGTAALQAGWPAQIQATYPCSWFVFNAKLGSCSITTQVTEVIQ